MPKLGVNIDHIATIREVRKTVEPDPIHAAVLAELGGADGITVHLRADRRHIQDRDVNLLKETVKTRVNLEMSTDEEIVKRAIEVKPYSVCIVPEKREEVTTEGGLNLKDNYTKVKDAIDEIKLAGGIEVSLFIDPTPENVFMANELRADMVELHTGSYANANDKENAMEEIKKLAEACKKGAEEGLRVNMGHGLTYKNIIPILAIDNIYEFNIGHSIVSHAVFVGMKEAVKDMIEVIKHYGEARK